ncbi:MAG TPA: hypothetical protein VF143_09360 [Candidatus Nanopelagicales bacterium]
MATKMEQPLEASRATPLEHMPPLRTTTEGIPATEHVEAAPTVTPDQKRRRTWLAWALAGVVGLLLVVVGVFALMPEQTSTGLHMGLTTQAWQQYRAGERASTPLAGPMGLTAAAWRDYRAGERATAPRASSTMGLTVPAWQQYRASERSAQPPTGHMGLLGSAWQQYRAGERATTTAAHMGLTVPAWQAYRAGERAV